MQMLCPITDIGARPNPNAIALGPLVGTPAVIIPTITERESNARRVVALGAGEIVLPMDGVDGEKHIDVDEFSAKVQRVLNEPAYRQSGRRIAESMRQFGGAPEAANRIERFAADKTNHRKCGIESS